MYEFLVNCLFVVLDVAVVVVAKKGETIGSKMACLLERYVPAIRVCSICFILYISVFWVRYQIRDGEGGGGEGASGWRSGLFGGGGGGGGRNKEDTMRLYGVRVTNA